MILIGTDCQRKPNEFAKRLVATLGSGAIPVCNLIERQAVERIQRADHIPEVAKFEAFARTTREVPIPPRPKPVLLHDHRIRDEIKEYYSRLEE